MIGVEVKEIDGVQFQVGPLDLKTERAVLVRLMKAVGPALAELARGGTQNASGALGTLLAGIDDTDLDYFVETFRKVSKIGMVAGDKTNWLPCVDSAFKNGATSQLKWLWFCLEHQFAGFLGFNSGGLESMLTGLMSRDPTASGSSSPQT